MTPQFILLVIGFIAWVYVPDKSERNKKRKIYNDRILSTHPELNEQQ